MLPPRSRAPLETRSSLEAAGLRGYDGGGTSRPGGPRSESPQQGPGPAAAQQQQAQQQSLNQAAMAAAVQQQAAQAQAQRTGSLTLMPTGGGARPVASTSCQCARGRVCEGMRACMQCSACDGRVGAQGAAACHIPPVLHSPGAPPPVLGYMVSKPPLYVSSLCFCARAKARRGSQLRRKIAACACALRVNACGGDADAGVSLECGCVHRGRAYRGSRGRHEGGEHGARESMLSVPGGNPHH